MVRNKPPSSKKIGDLLCERLRGDLLYKKVNVKIRVLTKWLFMQDFKRCEKLLVFLEGTKVCGEINSRCP